MEHLYYKDKLSAYFDSALEVQEMELLRRHLEGCAECRELLEQLSSLSQKIEELSGLDENEYFDSLAAKIDNRIARTDGKVVELPRKEFHRFGFGWKIGAVAASFMLIAIVTYYQWQDHESILDEIIEQSAKPVQSAEVLIDSVVEPESQSEQEIVAEEKADDKAVTAPLKEIEKYVPAAVGESKAKAAPKKIVDVKELQRMTKFETSRELQRMTKLETSSQTIVKPAPVLKQEHLKPDESVGDIAEKIVADTIVIEPEAAEELLLAVPPAMETFALTEAKDSSIESVQYWRAKRDSLLTFRVEASNRVEVSRVYSARKSKSVVKSDSGRSGYINTDSTLALAWYKIGLFTSDSTEKKEAIEFMEKYLKGSRADSAQIRKYLEELKD